MSDAKRVKILDTKYDEKGKLIIWKVKRLDTDEELTLAWPEDDLGPAIGINVAIPKEDMLKFLEDIKDKEINLVMQEQIIQHDNANIEENNKVMDQYPFYEVQQYLDGEDGNS